MCSETLGLRKRAFCLLWIIDPYRVYAMQRRRAASALLEFLLSLHSVKLAGPIPQKRPQYGKSGHFKQILRIFLSRDEHISLAVDSTGISGFFIPSNNRNKEVAPLQNVATKVPYCSFYTIQSNLPVMARDSNDFIQWHRSKSVGDALEQVSFNCFCGCLMCSGCISTCIWECFILKVWNCCGYRKPHFMKDRKAAKIREQNSLTPLPAVRERAITLPLPEAMVGYSSSLRQNIDQQTSSSLLVKLPLEVRQLVWGLVNSSDGQVRALHMFRRGQKMCHWRCRRQVKGQPCTWNDPCSRALPFNSLAITETDRYVGDPNQLRRYDSNLLEKGRSGLNE